MAKQSEGAIQYHPLYVALQATWRMALDVYEGLGGFLDSERPYLVPHPREWLDHTIKQGAGESPTYIPNPSPSQPSPKLKMRRKLARYENIADTILTQVSGAIFLHEPARTFGDTPNDVVAAWWANVDRAGTSMSAFIEQAWLAAGVFGHVLLLADQSPSRAETQADAQMPILRRYSPLDVIDWIVDDDGNLAAVKLLEAAPRVSFADKVRVTDTRVRVVTADTWALYDRQGNVIQQGEHGFGRLPVTILYAKRRPLTPVIGKAVMGDPQLHVDLYNLVSEVRELLRNQTFGILNVPLGTDQNASVEREKALIGQSNGTQNVLFSSQSASYISPDAGNVTVYHEHIDRLTRTIYRLASAPWESDSRDAESGDSARVKRSEQIQTLTKYAVECERADRFMLELAYRAMYGEQWERQVQKDRPSVAYSRDFQPPDFESLAKDAADSLALDLGPSATKEIKKRFVQVRLRGLDKETQMAIDAEIDGQDVLTAAEKQQQLLDAAATRLAKPGVDDEDGHG